MTTKWIDSAKTVLLSVLILISFLFTYILWSNQPQFQFIEPAEYVKSKPVPTRQLEDLVSPEAVIFHYGEDRHTKVFANGGNGQYQIISEEMKKWYFNTVTEYPISEEKWETLTKKQQGIEIQFRSDIPIDIISELFMINGDVSEKLKSIDRLWLYYEEEDNVVYALFMSRADQTVFRARTVVTPKELHDTYLPLGRTLPEQIMKVTERTTYSNGLLPRKYWQMYYLPKAPWKMQKYLYNYLPITEDELIDAYFLDRNLVRRIVERDKTVIFTDGSRSLQLQPDTQTITYTDPAYQQGKKDVSMEEKVRESITFINRHLGWTDDYHLDVQEKTETGTDLITFRQYVGPYPLTSVGTQQMDAITVASEDGQIVSVSRSLIDLDKYIDNQEWIVMSGPELFTYLRANEVVDTNKISDVYLSYAAQVHRGYVELTPAWVVETSEPKRYVITARSVQERGKPNGLE